MLFRSKCDFNVCVNCKAEPEGKRGLLCPNWHKLTYSKLPEGNSICGRCQNCNKSFKYIDGGYYCFGCKYECCNNCSLIIENNTKYKLEIDRKSWGCNIL